MQTTQSPPSRRRETLILTALLILATWNYLDRAAIGILQEPIKKEFGLSDFQLGLLGGPAFAFLYVILGVPFARLAERYHRVRIIVIVFAFWSLMTALCGVAASFLMLLLARAAVSVGEAGCTPSAHSLIADQFPPQRRPWALAVYSSGLSLGSLFAALAGGAIAQTLGWRATFYILGATGLLFAVVFPFVVPEPPRTTAVENTPSFGRTLRFLISQPIVRHIATGTMVGGLMGYSITQYLTSFFIRAHHLAIGQATPRVALVAGAAGAIGTWLGGLVGNRLESRRQGSAALVAAWGFCISLPLLVAGFLVRDVNAATVFLMIGTAAQLCYFGPAFAMLHTAADPRMRATAIAVVLLVTNLIGYGFGPPTTGAMSDALAKQLELQSSTLSQWCSGSLLAHVCQSPSAGGLQLTLAMLSFANLWAFYHFRQVSRHAAAGQGPSM